jgi:hypothetical protein
MKMKTFYVTLAQTVLERVTLRVEADTKSQAKFKALTIASDPESSIEWKVSDAECGMEALEVHEAKHESES